MSDIDIDAIYSGNNLSGEWLAKQPGGRLRVKIRDLAAKTFGGDGEPLETKVQVFFHGIDKVLALNVTNKNCLKELFGLPTSRWVGQEIELIHARVPYGNKIVDAVRINLEHNPGPAQSGNGHTTGGPAKPLGKAASDKLFAILAEKGMSLNDLRYALANQNCGGMVDASPESWPAEWGAKIKAWLDAPVKAPEGGYVPLDESSIPF